MKKSILILAFLASKASALQIPFPQDTIAYNNLFNNRQSVSFDPQGGLHVAYSGQLGTNSTTREIYYVTDSAGSFATRQVTANSVDDNYPTIAIDRDARVHIGFLGRDAGNLFQVQYVRLLGGGFTMPVFITQGGLNKATPYCTVGSDSVAHFVYFTFTAGQDNAYYRRYDLRDSTLSPEVLLTNAEVTGDFDASVATDTAGFVHIVVKSGSGGGGPLKYYTDRSGPLLETPTGVAVDVDYPRVLVDHANIVHILYRNSASEILYVVDNDSGYFGTPVPLTPPGQRPAGYHNFAVDSDNRVYVVYQSSAAVSGRGFYLVYGRDNVFSDTLLVYELPPEYLTRNTSAVAARGGGEVAVLYAAGASRGGTVVCDIFMKRGTLPTTGVQSPAFPPGTFDVMQNYPNPFNSGTVIRFDLGVKSEVRLAVYDVLGREVVMLVDEEKEPGRHQVKWDASGISSGIFFYRLQAGDFSSTRRCILLR